MALYNYECEHHGIFEAEHSIKDKPLESCPLCIEEGKISEPPKRLISVTNFVLQGSGWGRDLYGGSK